MDIESYFRAKRTLTNYCNKEFCHDNQSTECPLSIMNNNMGVRCSVLEQNYPYLVEQIIYEALRQKFPNGYIICAIDKHYEDINKCNKFKSCKECQGNLKGE